MCENWNANSPLKEGNTNREIPKIVINPMYNIWSLDGMSPHHQKFTHSSSQTYRDKMISSVVCKIMIEF